MPKLTVISWLVDEGEQMLGYEQMGELYADGGVRTVEQAVLSEYVSQFDIEAESAIGRDEHVTAFNSVTSGWHYMVKPLLAYELVQSDADYNDQFEAELMEYVTAEAMEPSSRDGVQVTLDANFESNPFDDDSLSRDEAVAVLTARMLGYDDTGYDIEDIGDGEAFASRLLDDGDLQYALNASHFDGDLPDNLIGEVARPDNWETDPTDIETRTCARCNDRFFYVTTEGGSTGFFSANMTELEVESLVENEEYYHPAQYDDGTAMCESCFDPTSEGYNVYLVSPEGIGKLDMRRSVAVNSGASNNSYISASGFSDDLLSLASRIGYNGTNLPGDIRDEMLSLHENDGPVNGPSLHDSVAPIFEGEVPLDYDGEPFIVLENSSYGADEFIFYAERDNWQQCRDVKAFMEDHD